ncbi:uncharacterized protein LOC110537867 isoform X1 [Oncorhynchus mykiss]|uniref:RAB11 family interacting protein 5b (class I) n=1 Tax=Oncorhynchus mykiss TaxID=8022 RepID=A0A8K9V7D8_ONCMY|nr:uncharacterized protein LOC110537867 isoform X1 [Oncorhynchus mykiss]
MMSLIELNDDQRWVPTHVNVTVLRARGLRTKGKHGSRYVYTIIQVGKDKYTTGLVEKATVPEWNEECCFELLPGILEAGGRSAFPSGSGDLVLTVMHRVLIGLDVFLGQAIVPLDKIFQDGMCPRDEWLKLNSKASRKEKERGEIQVTVQFTRNNMTASMFDLTMKDKPRSTFGKLKDRVTGRKRDDMESSSAIVPGRFAALSSSLGQPFGEGSGGGEDPGEVEVAEEKRSKVKDFFLGKGKLRRSSDTWSCSSLASESSVSSTTSESHCPPSLGLGLLVDPPSSPIYSSKVKDTHHGDTDLAKKVLTTTQSSPKILTHKRAFSDEASRITTTAIPRPCPAVESLKGHGMTLSQSSLCINGSHVYGSEPVGPKGSSTLPSKLVLLEKCSPLSRSLQNLTKRSEDKGSAGEGRRWSFDKVKKDEKDEEKEAEPPVSQFQSARVGGRPVQAAAPMLSSTTTVDSADKGKKLRKTLFSGGRSDSLPAKSELSQGSPPPEGRLRGWFGSSDSQNKPRLEVSPKVESESDTPPPLPPRSPIPLQCSSPSASFTGHSSPDSAHPTNPFTPSLSLTPDPISPFNPFLPRMQCNPFFEDLIAEEGQKSPPFATCSPVTPLCHSTALPSVTSPTHDPAVQIEMAAIWRDQPKPVARQTSLPALLPTPATASPPNPFTSRSISESGGGEWDESFDAFASSRLNSPKGSPTNHPSIATSRQAQVRSTPPYESYTIPPIEEMRMSEEEEPPRLPPRRPIIRTLVNERPSDSWLHRGQELAVQKEACLLSQTGAASLQHTREWGHKRHTPSPHLYPSPGKDLVSSDLLDFHTVHSQHYANMSPESPSPFKSEDEFKKFDYEPLRDEDDKIIFTEQDLWPDATDSIISLASEDTTDASPTVRKYAIVKNTSHSELKDLSLPVMLLNSERTVADLLTKSCPKHSKSGLKTLDIASTPPDLTTDSFSIHPDKPTKSRNNNYESPPLTLEDLNKNKSDSDFCFIDSASDASPSPSDMMTVHTLKSLGGICPQPPQDTPIALSHEQMMLYAEDMLIVQKTSTIDVNSAVIVNLPEVSSLCQDNCLDGGCELNTSRRDSASNMKSISIFKPDSLNIERETVELKDTQSPMDRNGNITKSKIDSSKLDPLCHVRSFPVSSQMEMQQEVVRNKQEVSQPLAKRTNPVSESSPRGTSSHRSLKGMIRELHGNSDANSPGKGLGESPLHQSRSSGQIISESIEGPFSYQPTKSPFSSPLSPNRETTLKAATLFVSSQKIHTHSSTQSIPKENCLTEHSSSKYAGAISFEDLHAKVAPNVRSPMSARLRPGTTVHASNPCASNPSSATPSLATETNGQAKLPPTPVPPSIHHPPTVRPSTGASATLAVAPYTSSFFSSSSSYTTAQPLVDARHTLLPEETQPASSLPRQESSPHPVKPLTTTASQGEKKECRSVLEKLKSSIHPGRSAQQTLAVAETEKKIEESLADSSAQYEQLTNMELISLLLQQEMDMEKQQVASDQQAAMLEKHEAELKKIKAQVRDLEDYIDKLLVQIMEQTPTLLQVRSRHK